MDGEAGRGSAPDEALDDAALHDGPLDDEAGAAWGRPSRPGYVLFSAQAAREIVTRTMAGETLGEICADPALPTPDTVKRWAKKHARFGALYARARAVGELNGLGATRGYCPVLAGEIAARVSLGEAMAHIAAEPSMPSLSTMWRWAHREPEFGEALSVARMAMADRFCAMGWTLAMEATPETAYLTQVRLKQLRWTCAVLSPTTYGRMKASDPPAAPEVTQVTIRTFQTEVNPETGQVRGVALHYDPETGKVTHEPSGAWRDPPFPLVRRVDYATAKKIRMSLGMNTDNPAAWDLRPSAKAAPEA